MSYRTEGVISVRPSERMNERANERTSVPSPQAPALILFSNLVSGQGCSSHLGYGGYSAFVSLSIKSGCAHRGTVMHELGHSLGEPQRPATSSLRAQHNLILRSIKGNGNQGSKVPRFHFRKLNVSKVPLSETSEQCCQPSDISGS